MASRKKNYRHRSSPGHFEENFNSVNYGNNHRAGNSSERENHFYCDICGYTIPQAGTVPPMCTRCMIPMNLLRNSSVNRNKNDKKSSFDYSARIYFPTDGHPQYKGLPLDHPDPDDLAAIEAYKNRRETSRKRPGKQAGVEHRQSDRPANDRSQRERIQSDRPASERRQSDRPANEHRQSDRPANERRPSGRPANEHRQSDRPSIDRSPGEHSQNDRSQRDHQHRKSPHGQPPKPRHDSDSPRTDKVAIPVVDKPVDSPATPTQETSKPSERRPERRRRNPIRRPLDPVTDVPETESVQPPQIALPIPREEDYAGTALTSDRSAATILRDNLKEVRNEPKGNLRSDYIFKRSDNPDDDSTGNQLSEQVDQSEEPTSE